MNSRLIKILFSCSVALYMCLVCFNNLAEYDSNFQFLQMIAKMEDTFSGIKNWRSISSRFVHHIFYILIIVWEIIVAVLLLLGGYKMINKFKAPAAAFNSAKKYTALGLSFGVLLWFTVFIAIAGEWFLMWQSKNWNAQDTAFFLTACFLLFLIHHNQEDV